MNSDTVDRDVNRFAQMAVVAIDENDTGSLRNLISQCPEILDWRDTEKEGEVLLQATTSYANFPGFDEEKTWNRPECAEILLDAGALTDPRVALRLMDTGARGMLELFHRKNALPENLRVFAALGDLQSVRDCFHDNQLSDKARPIGLRLTYSGGENDWPNEDDDLGIIEDAFLYACRLGNEKVGRFLLEKCVKADPDLGRRLQQRWLNIELVDYLIDRIPYGARYDVLVSESNKVPRIIWRTAINLAMQEAILTTDLSMVKHLLKDECFSIAESATPDLIRFLEVAAYSDSMLPIIQLIIDDATVLRDVQKTQPSRAISYALEYGHADYVAPLLRVWELPENLPHAAGVGDLAKVKGWFGGKGEPLLGDPEKHNPFPDQVSNVTIQDVLDRALAWAVLNDKYNVADFLLERGADINTSWSTHEPASILHECAVAGRLDQVKYLVDRGIDTEILDKRFRSTAEGWARHNGQDDVVNYLKTLRESRSLK